MNKARAERSAAYLKQIEDKKRRKKMRKKTNPIIVCAVAAAAVMMTACGGGNKETQAAASAEAEESSALSIETETKNAPEETESVEETEEAVETEAESEKAAKTEEKEIEVSATANPSGLDAAYAKVVDEYRQMIREKWDYDKIFDTNLSEMVADFYDMGADKEVGYTLFDLDGDGKKELLIGETDTKLPVNRVILDAYRLKNGKAEQIFVSQSRNRYYLVKGSSGEILVANEGSNGAANSGWIYYVVSGDQMKVVQSVTYDAFADEENPWFVSNDDDWDTSNDTPTDETEAQNIIDSYTKDYAKLDWTPIME